MDWLFKRYASPFLFIDGMIQTGRFTEFVFEFVKTVSDEKEEQFNWEYWLHKVWEGTYEAFRTEIENEKKNKNMPARTIETTVNDSLKILKNFNPKKDGGENE